MFGITMILVAIADYRAQRKNKERKRCDVCNQKFNSFEDAEEHRRKAHANVAI
jgi:tRNA U54 and U55 pseudouridine synthase Pus10